VKSEEGKNKNGSRGALARALTENIIKNILAISSHIKEYEFVHTYFGPPRILKEAKKIKIKDAYNYLLSVRGKLKKFIPDEFPYFRGTYYRDIIDSALIQAELFVFKNKKYSFKKTVETLFAVKLPPLINLSAARTRMYSELKKSGYLSVTQLRKDSDWHGFKNFKELDHFIAREVKTIFKSHDKAFGKYFDFDIKKSFDKFNLVVEKSKRGMPDCYYYYRGNYKGVMGLKFRDKFDLSHIKNLIGHEILPGHHFYYLVKESLFRNKKIDLGVTLDTFYSPETIINEGLAMSVDVLFGGILDAKVRLKGLAAKYLYAVLYNIWYSKFILKKKYKKYQDIIGAELGFNKKDEKFWMNFYLGPEWRYYAVSYAIGSYYVDGFLKKHGVKNARYLYNQQSVNTIKKLERDLKDGKKR